uniref:Uncharacterized protein n=1 Tax=Candidatus Kentrum sp. DK TaxID=2126562 RepID=A0A450RXN3_9GAMM|nr:MAG: hypothetical protein BECKDK2373B_GA0170837_100646 [Candidatus Kentron sp. DK]
MPFFTRPPIANGIPLPTRSGTGEARFCATGARRYHVLCYAIPPRNLTLSRECLDLPEKTGSSPICHILADAVAVFAPKGLRNIAQGCRVAATLG